MICFLIEELQINHVWSEWSWEASQVLPFAVLYNVSHFLEEEYCVVTNSFERSEVRSSQYIV